MTSRNRDEAQGEPPDVPWHNRTSTLLGASVAGVAALGVLVGSIMYVTSPSDDPGQAPLNYVEPAFTSTSSGSSSTPTTTGTITSTSPPVTTDINPDLVPSSTDPSSTSRDPAYRPPRTKETTPDSGEDSGSPTRRRPRTNVTRTLYPAP